jgi:hypothetical protein
MAENIAVPAAVLRQLAKNAVEGVATHRANDRPFTADRIQDHIRKAFDSAGDKDGEFVSIDGSVVSSLTAEACGNAPEQYLKASEVFLHQYNVWGDTDE